MKSFTTLAGIGERASLPAVLKARGFSTNFKPFYSNFLPITAQLIEAVTTQRNWQIARTEGGTGFAFGSDTGCAMHEKVIAARVANTEILRLTGDSSAVEIERNAIASLFRIKESDNPTIFFAASTTQANGIITHGVAGINKKSGGIALASAHSHFFGHEVNQPAYAIVPDDKITGKLTIADLEKAVEYLKTVNKIFELVHLDCPTKGDYFYTTEELKKITNWAHERQIPVSMDCERLVGFLARTGETYADYTSKCGIDIVTLGMQKIGGARTSAVIVLNEQYLPKNLLQRVMAYEATLGNITDCPLAVATGWDVMIKEGLYIENAKIANLYADRILQNIEQYQFGGQALEIQNNPLTTNMIFVFFSRGFTEKFNEKNKGKFSLSPDRFGVTRIVTAFDTGEALVNEYINQLNATYRYFCADQGLKIEDITDILPETATSTVKPEKELVDPKEAISRTEISVHEEFNKLRKLLNPNERLWQKKTNSETPAHSAVMEAFMQHASSYHSPYGDDNVTNEAMDSIKILFGRKGRDDTKVIFTSSKNQAVTVATKSSEIMSGTVTLVSSSSKEYHMKNNRNNVKFVDANLENEQTGKMDPATIERLITYHNSDRGKHTPLVTSVCLEQPTIGSNHVYSKDELTAIANACHKHSVPLILNIRSNFVYHLAATGENFADYTSCGVDIAALSFAHLGCANSSAIVVLNTEYLPFNTSDVEVKFGRAVKYNGGRTSSSATQNTGYKEGLETELWREIAENVNKLTNSLKEKFIELGMELDPNQAEYSNVIKFKTNKTASAILLQDGFKQKDGYFSIKVTPSLTAEDAKEMSAYFSKTMSTGPQVARLAGRVGEEKAI